MRLPRDAKDWPHADLSRMILHRPHRWHVQIAGQGPDVLLLHGAGGSAHSFRDLIPLLARDHRVIALDLPGQGFTLAGARGRCGIEAMAADILALAQHERWRPQVIVGHSAGGALALQIALDPRMAGARVVGINAALANFRGVAGWLFPTLARVLALSPFSADLLSATATTGSVRSLIRATGSEIDAAGIACYLRLAQDRAHVDGTLAMMAQWRLDPLLARLGEVAVPVTLIAAEGDLAVPPATSAAAAARIPGARLITLPALGHLAHEESPAALTALIAEGAHAAA